MKGNDSYPPADVGDSIIKEKVDIFSEQECDEQDLVESYNEDNLNEKSEEWDGSEAELVVDDETESYEEESTGIKIKYKLKPDEIQSFVEHSEDYQKNLKSQKKHMLIQSIVFIAMVTLGFITSSKYYLFLSFFPVIALILIWFLPYLSIKKFVGNILKGDEYSVEIFPDKIDVTLGNKSREILLDGSCESKELNGMILIFSKDGLNLIIPLRSIEPEFRADVQAMILAGAKPKYES